MQQAIKEAKKAYLKDGVPIGCVIVKENKIIATGYNQKEKYNCVTKHAEIIAIEKACKKLNSWHLNDCILYVTVEPCLMCIGAIMQSHIKKIVYSVPNEKFGAVISRYNVLNKNKIEIESDILKEDVQLLLSEFFKKKRKNNIVSRGTLK